jgi:hypothetical protein
MRTDPNSMAYKAVIQEMHAAGDTMSHTDALLQNRQTTHGSFVDNARIGQALRELFRRRDTWSAMPVEHREALDMIACKLSRILSGQSMEPDHWMDLSGYSTLALRVCEKARAEQREQPQTLAGYAELARQETAQATLR